MEIEQPVRATPEAAFAALTDWPAQGEWMLGTRVWVSHGTGREVGDELSGFTGIGRIGFLDSMTITDITAEMVQVRKTGRVLRGTGWMGVRSDGAGGAVILWGSDPVLPLGRFGRLGWTLIKPLVAAGFRRSLRNLAQRVAAPSAS